MKTVKALITTNGLKIKSKYLFVCLAFSMSLLSCTEELRIGAHARKFNTNDDAFLVLTTPEQENETHQITYKSVTYAITFDKDGIIRNILTNDQKFITPEGVRVGTSYDEIIKKAAFIKTDTATGALQQVLLKSGWYAVLHYTQPFADTASVEGFYKK